MRVEGVTLPEYYLAGRKRKVTPVEVSPQQNERAVRSLSFEKLQEKIRELDKPETGFGPQLDSRLAIALTAANTNQNAPINPQQAVNQYVSSVFLGQKTTIDV
jgi:hypothetical protein